MAGVNLGDVEVGTDLVDKDSTATVDATMTSAAVGDTTVVTITFGAPADQVVAKSRAPLTGTPSPLARSYAGTSCATGTVTTPSASVF